MFGIASTSLFWLLFTLAGSDPLTRLAASCAGMYANDMRHVPRSLLLIECARASVDPRTVRKLLAGMPVTGAARERAQRVIDRLSLTSDMIP